MRGICGVYAVYCACPVHAVNRVYCVYAVHCVYPVHTVNRVYCVYAVHAVMKS